MALLLLLLLFLGVVVQSTIETPSQHRSTIQACPKTGREPSPGPFTGNPCRRTRRQNPHGPRSRQKSKKKTSLREPAQSALQHQAKARICGKYHAKRSRTEVANHFVRACAVETHFDIKQEHGSGVNTTQNARGQSGRLNLAPRPFLLP